MPRVKAIDNTGATISHQRAKTFCFLYRNRLGEADFAGFRGPRRELVRQMPQKKQALAL